MLFFMNIHVIIYLNGIYIQSQIIQLTQPKHKSSIFDTKMGAQLKRQQKHLIIANLNFSGFKHAPFEFYSHEHYIEQEQLNNVFQKQLKKYRKEYKDSQFNKLMEDKMKDIGKLDKVIKSQRYSPLYVQSCGVYDGKLVNKEKFAEEWMVFLDANMGWKKLKIKSPKYKTQQDNKYERFKDVQEDYAEQLAGLLDFDYLIYSTILIYVYDNDQVENIINQRSCSKYLGFIEIFFSKSCLNSEKKTLTVLKFIEENNVDILFMQEATDNFCNELEKSSREYRFIKSQYKQDDPGYSLIVFRESSFKHANVGRKGNLKLLRIIEDKKMDQEERKGFLNWGKTAIISIDNFLLISAECSKNMQRIEKNLKLIKSKLPTKYVIIGATFHHGMQTQSLDDQFVVFPVKKLTNFKKRTYMQLQQQKSNEFIAYQNSFIVYDRRLKISNQEAEFDRIVTVNMKTIDYKALPPPEFDEGHEATAAKENAKRTKKKKQEKQYMAAMDKVLGLIPNQEHIFEELILLKKLFVPPKVDKHKDLTPEQLRKIKEERERLNFDTSSSEEQDNADKD